MFWSEQIFGSKNFLGLKKCLRPNKFSGRKYNVGQISWVNKMFLGPKHCLVKKYFWDQDFIGSKIIWGGV